MYRYHSFDWSEGSHKKVIIFCDECGAPKESELRRSDIVCFDCSYKDRCKSIEYRKKMSDIVRGRKTSEKTKKKLSEIMMGRKISNEWRENISKSKLGTKASLETKKKISEAHKRENLSEETLQKLSIARTGNKNPNWNGGVSFGKYCSKFNETKKKEVRDQYNNCDFISGLHKSIINNNENLDVHHIDYNKEQGCNDTEWKLIPLSHSHHSKTNFNKWFWNKLFINALEIDKWYYK